MRLLLVGAFPYPQNHGSQVYFQEQAIALRSMGAEITLLTYGAGRRLGRESGVDEITRASAAAEAAEHWRARDGFDHLASPKWTAPSSLGSGPSWAKPLADLGLAMTLRNAVASNTRHDAYDAILTHNAEATLAALHGLPQRRPPIVYCVHTLLGKELSAYLKGPKTKGLLSAPRLTTATGPFATGLDRLGEGIDRWLARRSDGWISLTQSAERVMRQSSTGPGALIPPAMPDPAMDSHGLDPSATARRHGLERGRYLLYSGNLDAYQELDILAAAARERSSESAKNMPLVIASHSAHETAGWTEAMPGVEFRHVDSSAEMQALLAGARASLLMRRAEGGFPIKLVNSLAAGTPVIAFHEREWGLENERNSLICSPASPVETMSNAIGRLEQDEALAIRLAQGARDLYFERHQPEPAARQMLTLIEELRGAHARR